MTYSITGHKTGGGVFCRAWRQTLFHFTVWLDWDETLPHAGLIWSHGWIWFDGWIDWLIARLISWLSNSLTNTNFGIPLCSVGLSGRRGEGAKGVAEVSGVAGEEAERVAAHNWDVNPNFGTALFFFFFFGSPPSIYAQLLLSLLVTLFQLFPLDPALM